MRIRSFKVLLVLALSLLAAACGDVGDPSPEAMTNRSVMALRAEEWPEAESLAEAACAEGGPEVVALADFVRGNVAFEKCMTAELQAKAPEAEPFAFDVAITYAETARSRWQLAASSRPDWPEARRNIERAMLKLDDLKRQKAQRRQAGRTIPKPRVKIVPGASPEDAASDGTQETKAKASSTELSPEQILNLFGKLTEKEQEKSALRRAHRRVRMAKVEKDW
jgi:hypothetical protein